MPPEEGGSFINPCPVLCSSRNENPSSQTNSIIPDTPERNFHQIEEGYNMTRTEAPKDFVGRGEENLARTTPELPRDGKTEVSAGCPKNLLQNMK